MTVFKKVSVIVPNYNYAKYLKRRISSILKQTYPVYELIILDDASSDDSKTVIRQMVAEAKSSRPEIKVKTIWSGTNSGKAIAQWIRGVEEASGDYIWIAEADDVARKDFLMEAMRGFEEEADVVLGYTESAIINKYGIIILPNFRGSRDREGMGHFKNSYIRSGRREIEEIMAIRCTIPNVSAVVFKNTFDLKKYLKQAEKFEQVGDWYLYAKLLEGGKIFYNRKSMNLFRVHGGSATKRGAEHVGEVAKMHEYFRRNYNLTKQVMDLMDAELMRIRQKYGIIK